MVKNAKDNIPECEDKMKPKPGCVQQDVLFILIKELLRDRT